MLLLSTLCACSSPPNPPKPDSGVAWWRVVLDEQPGALLSAWESSDGVLYAVGGTATRAFVLRHDGTGWWQMDPGTTHALWWVHGFSANDVWAVGAAGVVTHFDGTRWTVQREGGPATLFGVFGTTPSNLVAVGGVVSVSTPKPLVLRLTPAGWTEIAALPGTETRPLFKVWGRSEVDTFYVGERGLIARGPPEVLRQEAAGLVDRFTTVHGNAVETYIVGGLQRPVLLRRAGAGWETLSAPGTPQLLNGVAVNAQGDVVIVGLNGYLAEGRERDFTQVRPVTDLGLHAAVVTSGGFIAVGGDLVQTLGRGILLARGGLEGGPVRTWPNAGVPFDGGMPDAGVDAGVSDGGVDAGSDAGLPDAGMMDAGVRDSGVLDGGVDAGPVDGGGADAGSDGGVLGPGDECGGNPAGCGAGMMCWFVFGPFRDYCAGTCIDASTCGAYGAGACCKLPGPQAMENVCLRAEHCDGG